MKGILLDLALTANERSVGVHLDHFFRQWAVGTGVGRSSQDDRQVKQLAKLGMSQDVLLVESRVPVTSKLVETNLKVEDEQKLSYCVSCN